MGERGAAEQADMAHGAGGQMPRPIGNSELALHYAAAKGCVECVQSLLLVDAHESASKSQVIQAASSKLSSCSSGASTTDDGYTKVAETSAKKAASSSAASSNLSQGFSIERVRTQRFSSNAPMAHNQVTPVYLAAQEGHLPVLRLLVEEADGRLEARASDGMCALHAAAQMGNLDCIQWMLLERQLDPNLLDNEGATALHYAASRGHVHCIKWILRQSSAKLAPDFNGLTPLDDAAENGQLDTLKVLVFYATRTSTSSGTPICHLAPHFNRKRLRPSHLSRLAKLCLIKMSEHQDRCHLLTSPERPQYLHHQQLPMGARPILQASNFAHRLDHSHQPVQMAPTLNNPLPINTSQVRLQQVAILNEHRRRSLQMSAVDQRGPVQLSQVSSQNQLLRRQQQRQQQQQIKQLLEQQRLAKQAAILEEGAACCCNQAGCCPPPVLDPGLAASLAEQRRQANLAKRRKRQAALKMARLQQEESLRAQLESSELPPGPVPSALAVSGNATIVVESARPRESPHQWGTKLAAHDTDPGQVDIRSRPATRKLHKTMLKDRQGHLYSVPNMETIGKAPLQNQIRMRYKFNSPAVSMRSSKLITRLSIQAVNLGPVQMETKPPDESKSEPSEHLVGEPQVNLLDDVDQTIEQNTTENEDEQVEVEDEQEVQARENYAHETDEIDYDEPCKDDAMEAQQVDLDESERRGEAAGPSGLADALDNDQSVNAPSQHHEHSLTTDEDLSRHIPVRQSCRIVRRSTRAPIQHLLEEEQVFEQQRGRMGEATSFPKVEHNETTSEQKLATQPACFYGTVKSLSDARLFDRHFGQPDSSDSPSVSTSNESLERQSELKEEVCTTSERSKNLTNELDQICAMFASLPSEELYDSDEQIHTNPDSDGAGRTTDSDEHLERLRELDEVARQRSLSELDQRQHSLALATVRGCVESRQLVTRSESDPRLVTSSHGDDSHLERLAREPDSMREEPKRCKKRKSYIASTSYSAKMFDRHASEHRDAAYQERRATTVVHRRSLFGTLVDRVRRVGSADGSATTRASEPADRVSPMSLFDLQNLDANQTGSAACSRRTSRGSSLKAKAAALSRHSSSAKAPSCPPLPPPPPPPPPMPPSHLIGRLAQQRPLMSTFKQQVGALATSSVELRDQKMLVQRQRSDGLSSICTSQKQSDRQRTQARLSQLLSGHPLGDSDGSRNSFGESPGAHGYAASSRVAQSDCSADSGCCALDSMGTASNSSSSESPVAGDSLQAASVPRPLQSDAAKRFDGAFQPPKFLSPPEDGANIKPSEYLNRMRTTDASKPRPTFKTKAPGGPFCMQKPPLASTKTVISREPAELKQVVTIPLSERLQVYQSNCKTGAPAQQATSADEQCAPIIEKRAAPAAADQTSGATTLPHRRRPSMERFATGKEAGSRAVSSSTLGRQRADKEKGRLELASSSQLESADVSWRTTTPTTKADDVDFEKIAGANLSQGCDRDGPTAGQNNQESVKAPDSIRRAPVLTSKPQLAKHSQAGLAGGTSASKQILIDNDDDAPPAAVVASADDQSWAQRRRLQSQGDQPEAPAGEETTDGRLRHFLDRVARFDANGCEIPNWKRFMLAKRLAGRRAALGDPDASDPLEAQRQSELDDADDDNINNESAIAEPEEVVERVSDEKAAESDEPPAWRRQLRPTGRRLALASD